MKSSFYPKLAFDGIRKNRRLYFPYLFTGAALVMMYYILSFQSESPALEFMEGGTTLAAVLPLGCWIIAAFSFLFLFYTNSCLVKQRYRERIEKAITATGSKLMILDCGTDWPCHCPCRSLE